MQIETLAEAIKTANEIERLEGALKVMKDALKKFVEDNGAVDTGEKTWDFTESISWKFTPEKLKEFSRDLVVEGINPWALLSIGSKEIKETGLTEEALLEYAQRKVTKKFSSRKSPAKVGVAV